MQYKSLGIVSPAARVAAEERIAHTRRSHTHTRTHTAQTRTRSTWERAAAGRPTRVSLRCRRRPMTMDIGIGAAEFIASAPESSVKRGQSPGGDADADADDAGPQPAEQFSPHIGWMRKACWKI